MNDDFADLWAFDAPGALKALDDAGRFEGLAAPFGDADLSGYRDRFTAQTDFGRALKSGADLLYHHGLPSVGGEPNALADRVLGEAEFKATDAGIWMTGQLKLADAYDRKVWEAVKSGKLKLSTGSASHLVRREKHADGTHQVKRWPIVEVSLTPTPAHPRTSVYAIKSLLSDVEPPESAGFVGALKAAVSALDWACGQPKLNAVKADAVKALAESVRRYNAGRLDAAELQAGLDRLSKLTTRYQG